MRTGRITKSLHKREAPLEHWHVPMPPSIFDSCNEILEEGKIVCIANQFAILQTTLHCFKLFFIIICRIRIQAFFSWILFKNQKNSKEGLKIKSCYHKKKSIKLVKKNWKEELKITENCWKQLLSMFHTYRHLNVIIQIVVVKFLLSKYIVFFQIAKDITNSYKFLFLVNNLFPIECKSMKWWFIKEGKQGPK